MKARPEVEELFSIEAETGELPSVSRLIRAPSVAKKQSKEAGFAPVHDTPATGQSSHFALPPGKLKDATLLDFGVTAQLIFEKQENFFRLREFLSADHVEPWRAASAKGLRFEFTQFVEILKEFEAHGFVELSLETRPNFKAFTQFISSTWLLLIKQDSRSNEIQFLFSKRPLSPKIQEIKDRLSPEELDTGYGKIELAD